MFRNLHRHLPGVCGLILILLTAAACGKKSSSTATDPACVQTGNEEYHADNDIAMTVRSIADAIRVGEPLDSVDYDFEGVLTDGQGHPLYSDMNGLPGEWQVEVTSDSTAVIRNIHLGDLLPVDLEEYLLQALGVDSSARVEVQDDPAGNSGRNVYDFDGGYLSFETRTTVADNGQRGALVSIRASRRAPI